MATKPKTKKTTPKKVVKAQPKEGFLKSSKAKVCTYRKEKPAYFITWVVIGLILIGIATWAAAVAYERYQLNQAEKTLDTLAYDIKDALGEPLSITKEKSCSYPSTKMETIGRKPNCSVRYELTYKILSADEANANKEVLKNILISNQSVSYIRDEIYTAGQISIPSERFGLDFDTNSIGCSSSIDITRGDKDINLMAGALLSINLICSKQGALIDHF